MLIAFNCPTLDIIIVNWNSGDYLRKCLDSISLISCDGFSLCNVMVLDNASTDGSADSLDSFSLPLTIIKNKMNVGFSAACNQGAENSKADYLLFLNPDTRLFNCSIEVPVYFMEHVKNKSVGIVGIQLVDESGEVARTCARFPTPVGFFTRMFGLDKLIPGIFPGHYIKKVAREEARIVDQVMGAFFLVRSKLFKSLCGFDERYFVYYEELDFSFRAHSAGWKSVYLTTAQAYHKGRGSTDQIQAKRLFYSLCSRILYCKKHFNWLAAIAVIIGTIFLEPITRLIWAFVHVSSREIINTCQAYLLLWKDALGPKMNTNA